MPQRLILGIVILVVGVLISLTLAIWAEPWQAARDERKLTTSRVNVTSLLSELRELLKTKPEPELARTKEMLSRADSLNSRTAAQLARIQVSVEQGSQSSPDGKQSRYTRLETLRDLDALRQALSEARSLTSEATARLERVPLAMLDLNRRITDLDSRISTELEKMDSQLSSLSEPQKQLSSIWLPILLSMTTIGAGISTIWLGWRKDRREAQELRLKVQAS